MLPVRKHAKYASTFLIICSSYGKVAAQQLKKGPGNMLFLLKIKINHTMLNFSGLGVFSYSMTSLSKSWFSKQRK